MDVSLLEKINSVEDCKDAIRRVREMKEALVRNNQQKPVITMNHNIKDTDDGFVFFENIPLLDVSSLPDEDDTVWLKDAPSVHGTSVEELEKDRSFVDSSLLNVQYVLLNQVKSALFEQKLGFSIRDSSPIEGPMKSIERDSRKKKILFSPSNSTGSGSAPESNSNSPRWSSPVTANKVVRASPPVISKVADPSPPVTYRVENPSSPPVTYRVEDQSSPLTYRVENPASQRTYRTSAESSPLTYRVSDRELSDLNAGFISERSSINNEFYIATPSKNIDTRTYTRPKKTRSSIDPRMNVSGGTNTLTITRVAKRGSILNHNGSGNLNETFIQEDLDQTVDLNSSVCPDQSSRRVSRNLSYIVRRNSDSPASNNPLHLTGSSDELNTTFIRNAEDSISSPTDSNSSLHNISMEELHNMARLQEQSLKNASSSRTVVRKNTHVIMDFPIIDDPPPPRTPGRTSSTETYYVGESNPESPGSSGLSSPIDSQSYNDVSSVGGLGRSMPNLAMSKKSSLQRPGVSIAPPMNSLRYKNHYISDSKLSRPTAGSKLSILKSHASGPISRPVIQDHSHKEMQISNNHYSSSNGNTSVKSFSHLGGGDAGLMTMPTKMAPPVARSGLSQPRYPTPSHIRPPVVRSGNNVSMLPAPGFSSRLPVQTRIPAPGSGRGRLPTRPSSTNAPSVASSGRQESNSVRPRDWREGCY